MDGGFAGTFVLRKSCPQNIAAATRWFFDVDFSGRSLLKSVEAAEFRRNAACRPALYCFHYVLSRLYGLVARVGRPQAPTAPPLMHTLVWADGP